MAAATWTLDEVAAAVGGMRHGPADLPITGIGTDSRSVDRGSLFVAIAGENYDGHDYAAEAIRRGAAAALVTFGRGPGATAPHIEVGDTLTALRDLAAYRRSKLEVPVVAVTGSTGKTSTKDMAHSVLPGSWAAPASYNNEIGVPLTVLSTPADASYLIAEVGSRGKGHIEWLMPAVRPDVAVITNLGVVHLETFGTREILASAKWELVEGLEPGGVAVLPAAEPRLMRSHRGPTLTFGDSAAADVWFDGGSVDSVGRAAFTLHSGSEAHAVKLATAGAHQPWNAVAAAAAATALGRSLDDIAVGLEKAQGSPGRMEIHQGAVTIVNDAYNANPDSMEAALRTVASMPGRHVAVVGLMAELGSVAEEEHARIGALTRELGFAAAIVVGAEPGLAAAAGAIARPVADADEAERVLRGFLRDGDVVLVKASHAVGLEALAGRLVEGVQA